MALISFFKLPRHRQFNYQPLYYDERKEELEKRIKEIEEEEEDAADKEDIATRMRKGMRMGYFSEVKRVKRASNIRLAVILLALVLLSYILFFK